MESWLRHAVIHTRKTAQIWHSFPLLDSWALLIRDIRRYSKQSSTRMNVSSIATFCLGEVLSEQTQSTAKQNKLLKRTRSISPAFSDRIKPYTSISAINKKDVILLAIVRIGLFGLLFCRCKKIVPKIDSRQSKEERTMSCVRISSFPVVSPYRDACVSNDQRAKCVRFAHWSQTDADSYAPSHTNQNKMPYIIQLTHPLLSARKFMF